MLSKDLLTDLIANQEMFLCNVAGEEFSVLEFGLKEKIFDTYKLELLLVSEEDLEFDSIVGKDAKLTILSDDTDRYVSGIVNEFEMEGVKGRFRMYRVTIVPRLWLMNLSLNTFMFQEISTPDIIKQVLKDAGITSDTYEFRLQKTYKPREYCVQYKETGLEFISRLLSEEGIFYFFEFTDEGAKLIFGDSAMNYKNVDGDPTIAYREKGSFIHSREFVTEIKKNKKLVTGKYSSKDYDFKEPSRNMNTEAKLKDGNSLEFYEYPGHYEQHKNGDDRSKMNMERLSVYRDTITGSGSVPQFSAGKVFKLEGHEIDEFNASYFIESVTHKGYQPQVLQELADTNESSSFTNTFIALPDNTTFRPSREYGKPVVQGVQTAIVTGPDGEEIYTDEFGRVKVLFHWDRVDKDKAATSCWIRVGQAWTGSSWGSVNVPRIGQEVIVSFIEGDPDRPVITGRVYHADNYRPYSLPADKTKTVFKTNSTPGGGGFNELTFEDRKGNEEIFIHAEKDMETVVENDDTQTVKRDRLINVLQHHTETITGETVISMLCSLLETIGVDETRTVGMNFTETIGVDSSRTIGNNEEKKVGVDSNIDIGANLTENVGTDETENIGNDHTVTVGNDFTESIGNDQSTTIGNDFTGSIGNDSTMNIGNDTSLTVGNNSTINVGNDENYTLGNNLLANVGNDATCSVGNNLTATVTAVLNATADGAFNITSTNDTITISAGAATISLANNGDITIDGANINIKGSGDINMKGSKINQN